MRILFGIKPRMNETEQNKKAIEKIRQFAEISRIDVTGAKVRRSSSRFCFGVEHGDYNGTDLFGVGTDRFIWLAYKARTDNRMRLFSGNFPDDGVIEFELGQTPQAQSPQIADTWARFAWGSDFILQREGFSINHGFEAIIYGNIPGGGMSRSASLTLNLILTLLEVNDIEIDDPMKIVDLAQAVENDYIGSPCGKLDQIMILFAKTGMGTYYQPAGHKIEYTPLGEDAIDFRIVVMDTGTVRPGLEKSTYKIRRTECEELVALLQQNGYTIENLADVNDQQTYEKIKSTFEQSHPDHVKRLKYIYAAQQRFFKLLDAWRNGDVETIGHIFREDGIGLREDYQISGQELEAMCDIARTVPGVLGERMLGGGDKGASGAIVKAENVDGLYKAIHDQYPKKCPRYADKFALHTCRIVDGIKTYKHLDTFI